MPLIEWKDEFNTGVEDVDGEHRRLIEQINVLNESLAAPTSKNEILDGLGEIYARISAHFALEEKIMLREHYDEYEDHKQDHENLLEQLRDIMDSYEDEEYLDDTVLEERLNDWFTVHFKTRDARLHERLG